MRHAFAGSLGLVCAWAVTAAADDGSIIVELSVDASHVTTKHAPEIHAVITGAPDRPARDFELRAVGDDHGVQVATQKKTWAQGKDRLALVVVMQGNELWVGNTQTGKVPADDPSRMLGALTALQSRWASIGLSGPMAIGSEGALVTYDDAAHVRVPLGPITNLTAAALGTENDYYNKTGGNLRAGAEAGFAILEKSTAPLRLLVIIGDGTSLDMDGDKGPLLELTKHAARDNIRVTQVIYKDSLSDAADLKIGHTIRISSANDIVDGVASAVHGVTNRQYLVFPGEHFAWDGTPHELAVMIRGEALDSVELPTPVYSSELPTPWLFLGFLGGGLVLLLAWTRWYSAGA